MVIFHLIAKTVDFLSMDKISGKEGVNIESLIIFVKWIIWNTSSIIEGFASFI